MTPLDPYHPNLRLGEGSHYRNEERRQQLRQLLAITPPLTFAEIAEQLGITRERVRVLALEEEVRGRVKEDEGAEGEVKVVGRLRGRRRWHRKVDAAAAKENPDE